MKSKKFLPLIIFVFLGLFVGAAVTLILIGRFRYESYNGKDFIDTTTYQAVFLTNNQIYFGHLKNISPDYLILNDVYYVLVNQPAESASSSEKNSQTGKLVKLGETETHGPRNGMILNRQQVLFWENLASTSQIIKIIQNLGAR